MLSVGWMLVRSLLFCCSGSMKVAVLRPLQVILLLPLLTIASAAGSAAVIAAEVHADAPVQPEAKAGSVADADSWAFTIEPYGYLPWVNATTTVNGFESDTYLGPGQILNHLQSIFSARASADKGRIGVLTDIAYSQLGSTQSTTTRRGLFTGSSEVDSFNGIYDVALRYRFGARESAVGRPGSSWLIPYAGVRIVQAQLGVQAQLQGNGRLGLNWQREGELSRTWAQLLVGSQASVFLTPALRLFGRADVGGFGMAGAQDLTGNAQVGLGYALGNNTDLNVSWRYLGIAYSNGAPRPTGYTSYQDGVELGVKFYF